ncbi:MAG TPA: hypothetical protein VFS59_12885 [Gemmatimonadaceae bacterium]|nr:hypothetical protein [Gemmatimonadaceae bacterium]
MSDDIVARGTALLLACAVLAAPNVTARAQAVGAAPAIVRTVNRTHTLVEENGRSIVRLDAKPNDGIAVVEGAPFVEGTIELDVRGEDVQQQSFVGVAWGVQNDTTYEAVYMRPFNFRTPDTARAKRAVQYVAHPTHPWQRLRAETPGKYEKSVSPVPDPTGWVPVRLVVTRTQVSVYANGGDEPDLVVPRLSDVKPGPVALWVGNNSRGDFANLRVTSSLPGAR